MTARTASRRPATVFALAGFVAALTFGLAGCQSDQEQRMAEARELLRQKQTLGTATARPAVAGPDTPAAAPANGALDSDIGMPLYPGARRIPVGSGQSSSPADPLPMVLLETPDTVDAVISFYVEKLKTPGSQLQPVRSEEKLDGRRVVRLSVPREDGGLQTVEARDEAGKTGVQLMNMKGSSSAIPARIPGLPPPSSAANPGVALPGNSAKDLPSIDHGGASPRDLTVPPSSSSGAR